MRLLTHNQLVCVRKGCAQHYPLALAATKVEQGADGADSDEEEVDEEEEAAAQMDFVLHLLPNLDYAVLRAAATTVSDHTHAGRAAAQATSCCRSQLQRLIGVSSVLHVLCAAGHCR